MTRLRHKPTRETSRHPSWDRGRRRAMTLAEASAWTKVKPWPRPRSVELDRGLATGGFHTESAGRGAYEPSGYRSEVVLIFGLAVPDPTGLADLGRDLAGPVPEASTSGIVSSATLRCSSVVQKISER